MKNIYLLFWGLVAFGGTNAQGPDLKTPRAYLSVNQYKPALPLLLTATADAQGKNNAESWYLLGVAYVQQALDSNTHEAAATSNAYVALTKAIRLKPDYGKEINNPLYSVALLSFNEGVAAYAADPATAYGKFMRTREIYSINGGSRFKEDAAFSDVAISALSNAAYSAYAAEKNNEALPLFLQINNKDVNYYQALITIYQRLNRDAESLPAIIAARAAFPEDKTIRNMELNYHIRTGKSEGLLEKLENAVKQDPQNAELYFNLANAYEKSAYPKDANGALLAEPADFQALFAKSEQAYGNAVRLNSTNADYYYNYGVLYYEKAGALIKKMNQLGSSAAADEKYDLLAAQQKALFNQALPLFEKTIAILQPQTLTEELKTTYRNSLVGAREIYSRTDRKDKAAEMSLKLSALK